MCVGPVWCCWVERMVGSEVQHVGRGTHACVRCLHMLLSSWGREGFVIEIVCGGFGDGRGWERICLLPLNSLPSYHRTAYPDLILENVHFFHVKLRFCPYEDTKMKTWSPSIYPWKLPTQATTKHFYVIIHTFSPSLSFTDQINSLSKSCHFHIRDIRHIRHLLPLSAATELTNSFISSKLDYCNSLYNGILQANLNKIQRILWLVSLQIHQN